MMVAVAPERPIVKGLAAAQVLLGTAEWANNMKEGRKKTDTGKKAKRALRSMKLLLGTDSKLRSSAGEEARMLQSASVFGSHLALV
jgi:hypothetical protein